MSYIIAFVTLSKHGEAYPVQCFRTDIKAGEYVLVQFPEKRIATGKVEELQYLGWNCSGIIKAKVSEGIRTADGYWSLNNAPLIVGFATHEPFNKELQSRGWIPLKRGNVHSNVFTNSNRTSSANILVRRNGIDLQILEPRRESLPKPFSIYQESISSGRVVRHYFSHTTFNLYEGILRFADSFVADEEDYERFFKSVGSSDRRNDELKQMTLERKRIQRQAQEENALGDYYDMISDGSGQEVYLGDGMWVGSGGSLHDRGRYNSFDQ